MGVAAAKFGTDQPIDDPSRERHELDANAKLSAEVRFRLDALHRKALTIALRPVCASG
jgi:hypothetical protein